MIGPTLPKLMNVEPHWEQALDGTLSEAEWQQLLSCDTLRAALGEQVCMDAVLRVKLEELEIGQSIEDAIMASIHTAPVTELEAKILAATIGLKAAPMPRRVVRPAVMPWLAAAAVTLIIAAVTAIPWRAASQRPGLHPVVQAPVLPPVPTHQGEAVESSGAGEQDRALSSSVQLVHTSHATGPLLASGHSTAEVPVGLPAEGEPVDFEKHIVPVLERSCYKCHSARLKKPKGDIVFDDAEAMRERSRTDRLIVPHEPDKSVLIAALTRHPGERNSMPPMDEVAPLHPAEVGMFRRWIDEGASFGSWTRGRSDAVSVSTVQ